MSIQLGGRGRREGLETLSQKRMLMHQAAAFQVGAFGGQGAVWKVEKACVCGVVAAHTTPPPPCSPAAPDAAAAASPELRCKTSWPRPFSSSSRRSSSA